MATVRQQIHACAGRSNPCFGHPQTCPAASTAPQNGLIPRCQSTFWQLYLAYQLAIRPTAVILANRSSCFVWEAPTLDLEPARCVSGLRERARGSVVNAVQSGRSPPSCCSNPRSWGRRHWCLAASTVAKARGRAAEGLCCSRPSPPLPAAALLDGHSCCLACPCSVRRGHIRDGPLQCEGWVSRCGLLPLPPCPALHYCSPPATAVLAGAHALHTCPPLRVAEAVVRGYKLGLLTTADYNNLCQCETLEDIKLNLVSACWIQARVHSSHHATRCQAHNAGT